LISITPFSATESLGFIQMMFVPKISLNFCNGKLGFLGSLCMVNDFVTKGRANERKNEERLLLWTCFKPLCRYKKPNLKIF
jgi:hypothetical protein